LLLKIRLKKHQTMRKTLLLISSMLLSSIIFAQNDCNDVIAKANADYQLGKFNQLIESINVCYHELDYEAKIEARKLKAKSYLAIDSSEMVAAEIKGLLALKPDFETAYGDPPLFVKKLNEIKINLARTRTTSVSKKAEQIELTPATIAIITDEDIRNRGYMDLQALFHDLSGFDISRSMGITYANLYQRGYRSAAATDRTMLLVDGVEDNEIWSNFAWISRQYALSNIKRIEIVYGPASTIYGANAFSGVVNIVTKDEFDYFDVTKKSKRLHNYLKINAQTVLGAYNTRYTDVTAAVRSKKIFFTLTGRIYETDEMDLSKFDAWNYSFNQKDFNNETYLKKLSITGSDLNGNNNAAVFIKKQQIPVDHNYYNVDYMDGKILSLTPSLAGISRARQLDSLQYLLPNGELSYKNFKHDIDLYAKLKINDFTIGFQWWNRAESMTPTYTDLWLTGSSKGSVWNVKQAFFYIKYDKYITNKINISNFGLFRANGIYPNNRVTDYHGYINGGLNIADLALDKKPYWQTTYLHEASTQMRNETKLIYLANENISIVSGVEYRYSVIPGNYVTSLNKDSVLDGKSPNVPGGNIYNCIDIGAFLQASAHIGLKKAGDLYLTIGSRFDNNKIREKYGYGSVFNPRLSAVYQKNNFIVKAIYAEAFKDASNFNKFSTSATRLLTNPTLEPEKVSNLELNFHWQNKTGNYVELVGYSSIYTNVLETAVVEYSGGKTTQFKAIGRIEAQGIQMNSYASLSKKYKLYANYTFTHPYKIEKDKRIRLGDIARHQYNLGANAMFFNNKLNVNLRMNWVGSKETGKNTTVIDNPVNSVDAFILFNGAITYNNLFPGLSIQMILNNILDNQYYHPGIRSADGIQYASLLPQYNRSLFIRLFYDLVPLKK